MLLEQALIARAIETSYQEILRQGVEAFKSKVNTASASASATGVLAAGFQEHILQSAIDERVAEFRALATEAVGRRPGTGLLIEVLIFEHPPSSGKKLVGVHAVGTGTSETEAAVMHLTLDHASPPLPLGMVRSGASYMLWYTVDNGSLKESRLSDPAARLVWRNADQQVRRAAISRELAVSRQARLSLATQTVRYAEAAKYVEDSNMAVEVKERISRLERKRLDESRKWEAAVQKFRQTEAAAERAKAMVSIMRTLDAIVSGLSLAESLTSQPVTHIDGAPRPDDSEVAANLALWREMEATAAGKVPITRLEAEDATTDLKRELKGLKEQYESLPGFPADKVPELAAPQLFLD